MCMSYGCGKLNDDRGDPRNITLNDVDRSAQAAGISRDQAVQNLLESCDEVSSLGPSEMGHSQWMDSPELGK
jgi:hypothetical protein